jgi:hypothetical protein
VSPCARAIRDSVHSRRRVSTEANQPCAFFSVTLIRFDSPSAETTTPMHTGVGRVFPHARLILLVTKVSAALWERTPALETPFPDHHGKNLSRYLDGPRCTMGVSQSLGSPCFGLSRFMEGPATPGSMPIRSKISPFTLIHLQPHERHQRTLVV